jgi:hypothetical protein
MKIKKLLFSIQVSKVNAFNHERGAESEDPNRTSD